MRYLGEKEIESLKWQYLELSELYREYCDWKKKKTKNPELNLPGKFEPESGPILYINPIVELYRKYGDIHETSFDDWYVRYYQGDGADKGTSLGCVDDLSGAHRSMKYFMRNTFLYIIEETKRIEGREPSLLEMADLLCITMHGYCHSQSYLKITQADFSKAEVGRLVKKVRKILMKKLPSKRFVKDELKRYLKIYIMRTSNPPVTYREISKEIFPRLNFEENRRRALIKDFNNAKRIIKNIENDAQIWWSPEK